MASTASAMSLSNFQLITSSQVPLGCILAYNTPILGCSNADFTQGNTCSASCARALQRIEDALISVCGDATVPSTSVLGMALSGGLVELLCPSGKTTTTASQPSVSQSSTAAVVITQTTRQIGTFSPIPTPTTLQTSTTTSSSSAEEDSETEAQTSTSSSEPEPQPTETIQATEVAPAPAVTSSPAGSPTQTTGAQQTKAPPQTTSDRGSGGGSPFDIATVASGSQQLTVRWLEVLLLSNAFMLLLWR
ncbi:hypothetical protein CONLIGDRAFT_711462 [Coniochaeta ligniaria NRRL 30616]|uniref:Uncharacterized protein n=1 Tax=Coniochaeta ligniaria NRRL 30616 TaxID=1408157 RepID=A0A1J7JW03_9PEZI|nr:hypothetical protein CONLIGDRAFT_711462 [Coniochaeta ligniaria NRRL 30616]